MSDMMNPKKAKLETEPTGHRVMSFRASMVVQTQLAELCKKWGESITQAIHRALAQAHDREFNSNLKKK